MVAFTLAVAIAVGADSASRAATPPDEIVVTGERLSARLRDTASSVDVIRRNEIESSGAHKVDQLLAAVPNVQFGGGSQGPAIRGMDTTGPLFALPAFLGGNRPRTTIVVDGRAATYNEFVFGAFPVWDVERIEVFRTPQTTTQGTNSIAGAIFVNSADPGEDRELRVRGIVGSLETRQLSALASSPIGDSVGLRISTDWRTSRTSSRIRDDIRGADPNDDDQAIFRAKLVHSPSTTSRTELTYVHSRSQSPQSVGVTAPFKDRTDVGGYGVFRIRVHSLTAVADRQLLPDLSMKVTLSGGVSDARRFAIPNFGEARNNGRDWSGEMIMNWNPPGSFRLLTGGSFQRTRLKQSIDLAQLSGAIGRFEDRQTAIGLFTDAQIDLTSRLRASAGIRYQRDRQRRTGALTATGFAVPIDYLGMFDAWLPKATISYDVTEKITAGLLVQRAYNPGGTTIRVDTLRPDTFAAETLWDYEAFIRAGFGGGKGSLAINAFQYDMRNAQRARNIRILAPSGRPVGFANLFNVDQARSRGIEIEASWRGAEVSASLGIGLLQTKILKARGEGAFLDGNEFERSPRLSGSLSVEWRASDALRLSLLARHHSGYFSDGANSPGLRISSGTSVDGRVDYRIGKVSLFGQVRNAFDAFNLRGLDSVNSGEAEDPRTFFVGIESGF